MSEKEDYNAWYWLKARVLLQVSGDPEVPFSMREANILQDVAYGLKAEFERGCEAGPQRVLVHTRDISE